MDSLPILDRSPCSKCGYPHIHSDQEAMKHLADKLPAYAVVDINQCEEKVLLNNDQGKIVVFSYSLRISSSLSDNRFDYYIHGDITAHDRLITQLFKSQAITNLCHKEPEMNIGEEITEEQFDALCENHSVLAGGTDSGNCSTVTVIGNANGTPVAIRYSSIETDHDFKCYLFNFLPIHSVTLEHES